MSQNEDQPGATPPNEEILHLAPARSAPEPVPAKVQKPKADRVTQVLDTGRDILENFEPAQFTPQREKGAMTTETAEAAIEKHVPEEVIPAVTRPAIQTDEIRLSPGPTAAAENRPVGRKDDAMSSSVTFNDDDDTAEPDSGVSTLKLATDAQVFDADEDEDDDEEVAFALMSVKGAMKVGLNPYIKDLKNFNPNPADIVIEDIGSSDQDFQKAYVESRNNLLTAPRGVRVPLLLSGYHADISSFAHADTIGISRHLGNEDYVQRMELILSSVFEHILTTSKGEMTFEQWSEVTRWPDLETAFFGLYHASYPGIQKYVVKCHNCGNSFPVEADNEELAYLTGKYVREQDVRVIMSGQDAAIRKTPLWKKANPEKPIRHILATTKIVVEYGIPTISEYMGTLRSLQASGKFPDVGNIEDRRSTDWPFLRIYPYVRRVALPVIIKGEEGKEARYKGTYDRDIIVGTLNSLSSVDFDSLFEPKEVIDLLNLNSIRYSLKAMNCTHCTKPIRAVPLNMKETFFTRVREISDLE